MARSLALPFLTAAALLAVPAPVRAADAVADAGANTIVLRPLTLLNINDLDFGTLIPTALAGTATLDPATGAVTTAGGISAASGATSAARFMGAGTRRRPVIIRIPRDPVTLTRVSGTETMTVTNWTLDGNSTRLINPYEAYEFRVGGRLNVGANQAPGTYAGTFDVTVQYQ